MPAADKKNYTSIYTDDETREALRQLANVHGVSRSEVVRMAIHSFAADKNKEKIRRAVRRLAQLTGA